MTIILGGDSFTNKTKTPKPIEDRRAPLTRVREDGDSTGDPRTRLGILFVFCHVLLFSYMNDTLFKSFSMHLYILSYMI